MDSEKKGSGMVKETDHDDTVCILVYIIQCVAVGYLV